MRSVAIGRQGRLFASLQRPGCHLPCSLGLWTPRGAAPLLQIPAVCLGSLAASAGPTLPHHQGSCAGAPPRPSQHPRHCRSGDCERSQPPGGRPVLCSANPSLPPFVPSLCSATSRPGVLASIAEGPSCRQPPPRHRLLSAAAAATARPPPLPAAAEPARWAPAAASPTGRCRTCRMMNTTLGEVAACCACAYGPCPCVRRQPPLALFGTRPCSAQSRSSLTQAGELWQHLLLQLGAADALLLQALQVRRRANAARAGCCAVAPNQMVPSVLRLNDVLRGVPSLSTCGLDPVCVTGSAC